MLSYASVNPNGTGGRGREGARGGREGARGGREQEEGGSKGRKRGRGVRKGRGVREGEGGEGRKYTDAEEAHKIRDVEG